AHAETLDANPDFLKKLGNQLKAAALEGEKAFGKVWHEIAAKHPDLLEHIAEDLFAEFGVETYDELMSGLKLVKEADEPAPDEPAPDETTEEPAPETDDVKTPSNAAPPADDQPQDVGSVAEREGFTKSKREMFAF